MTSPSFAAEVVIIRGGGLGDFLLTIPILHIATTQYDCVHLFTRAQYFKLVPPQFYERVQCHDIDLSLEYIKSVSKARDVISFWNDARWIKELEEEGARQVITLDPRPNFPKHVVSVFFSVLKWKMEDHYFLNAWLGDCWDPKNKTLWIHPGSGSEKKNAPIHYFTDRASSWLRNNDSHQVVFSFGEADSSLLSQVKQSVISQNARFHSYEISCLKLLMERIRTEAACYLGNDSGPTHMAAMLGVPTEVFFISSNPEIWKPLGPRVQLLGGE